VPKTATSSSPFRTRDDVQVLFLTFITTVIVAHMAYTRVVCASMHVLFLVRKFLLCAIAFAPGKLRLVLKIADIGTLTFIKPVNYLVNMFY